MGNGSALAYWRDTRQSASVSHTQVQGLYWRVALETKLYGFGKVCSDSFDRRHCIIVEFFATVKPDADFECMGVLMTHSQGRQMRRLAPFRRGQLDTLYERTEITQMISNSVDSRVGLIRREDKPIRGKIRWTIGMTLPPSPGTRERFGPSHSRLAGITWPPAATIKRYEFGKEWRNTNGSLTPHCKAMIEAYTRSVGRRGPMTVWAGLLVLEGMAKLMYGNCGYVCGLL